MYAQARDGSKKRNGFDLGRLYAPPDHVEVWPDNWPAVVLFQRCGTQWRTGFGGPTGLDYTALYPLIDRMHLAEADWLAMLDDIRVLESAALGQMAEDQANSST